MLTRRVPVRWIAKGLMEYKRGENPRIGCAIGILVGGGIVLFIAMNPWTWCCP